MRLCFSQQDRRRCRGILIADALVGLFIAAMLLTVIAVSGGYSRRAQMRAQDQHRLITQAELTLLAMQRGQPVDAPVNSGIQVRVEPVDVAGPGHDAPWTWVRVEARSDDAATSLIGRVPRAHMPHEGDEQ